MLFDGNKRKGYFTYESSCQLFNSIADKDQEDLVAEMRLIFIYSQMTNLKDGSNPRKYYFLLHVELLEMICRVSHNYWENRRKLEIPRENVEFSPYPYKIVEQVEDVLMQLFKKR